MNLIDNIEVIDHEEVDYELNEITIYNDPLIKFIVTIVEEKTHIQLHEMRLPSRKRKYAVPRFICQHFIKKYSKYSYIKIADYFNRTHATIINAINKIDDLCTYDKELKALVDDIQNQITFSLLKNKEQKYKVFKGLLDSTIKDEEQKQNWIKLYLKAK